MPVIAGESQDLGLVRRHQQRDRGSLNGLASRIRLAVFLPWVYGFIALTMIAVSAVGLVNLADRRLRTFLPRSRPQRADEPSQVQRRELNSLTRSRPAASQRI